jgi:hypothetical protein
MVTPTGRWTFRAVQIKKKGGDQNTVALGVAAVGCAGAE